MASGWYIDAIVECMKGTLDLDAVTLKVALVDNTYTFDKTHQYMSSITGGTTKELVATGYTGGWGGAGRKTLASVTVTKDAGNGRAVLDAADPATWTGIGGATNDTLRQLTILTEAGSSSDANTRLVCNLDLGADYLTNGSDITAAFAATGIAYVQC